MEKIPYKKTEKYKEYNKEYQRAYRRSKRILKDSENIETPNILLKRKNKGLSDGTKKQYIKIILRLHKEFSKKADNDLEEVLNQIFSGEEITDYHYNIVKLKMTYVNNTSFVTIMENKYLNKTSLKVNLIPFTTLLGYLSGNVNFKKKYEFFNNYIVTLNNNYEKERDNNYISEEDKKKIIIDYTDDTLLGNIEKLDNSFEKIIYGIYTMMPPRRLEYQNVYISSSSYKVLPDKNYLILHKKIPQKFIFQDYKTSKTYGRVELLIPEILKPYISQYLKENKIKNNDLFINLNKMKFTNKIKKTFYKVYNEDISVRWLRISYATMLDGLDISNNEKEEKTIQMGHNLTQSGKYKKLLR
tara:strand:+ start:314 stop:1384 length:1071 start_codon:yes stop_codon:yes gene_type:complete